MRSSARLASWGAEAVAAVDDRDLLRPVLEVERPVNGRVAAADDQDTLVAEPPLVLDEVVDAVVHVLLDARPAQPVRLERTDAGREDHRSGEMLVRGTAEAPDLLTVHLLPGQRVHALVEDVRRLKEVALLDQQLDEVFS